MGNGKLLFDIVAKFCSEEFRIKRFVTNPSGMSKEIRFWEKQGFKYFNMIEVEKCVNRLS